jgi:hypothetical protein
LKFALHRWIDMAARGWYSGDTHVHRSLDELPNVMRAEDLNVAFPLTYWVRRAGVAPDRGDKTAPKRVLPQLIIEVTFNERDPGHVFRIGEDAPATVHIEGAAGSIRPLDRLEVVVNGRVAKRLPLANAQTSKGAYRNPIDTRMTLPGSSWIAVRCFEQRPAGRVRFAHTNPVHVDVAGKPLRPRREEIEYFVHRMEEEIARNKSVLSRAAMDEYREALRTFRNIAAAGTEED